MEKKLQKIYYHRIKCKFGHDDKKSETWVLNISIATAFLNT